MSKLPSIKTPNTTYQLLCNVVKPRLTHYKNDLIEDKKALKNFTGEFIHASRSTGTNLFKFEYDGWDFFEKKGPFINQVKNSKVLFFGYNDLFLHYKDGVMKEISKEKVKTLIDIHVKDMLLPRIEFLKKLQLELIAFDLYIHIKSYKTRWRSKLKEFHFEEDGLATLRRLRNYFKVSCLSKIGVDTPIEGILNILQDNLL